MYMLRNNVRIAKRPTEVVGSIAVSPALIQVAQYPQRPNRSSQSNPENTETLQRVSLQPKPLRELLRSATISIKKSKMVIIY
jgi:hypothetical protein